MDLFVDTNVKQTHRAKSRDEDLVSRLSVRSEIRLLLWRRVWCAMGSFGGGCRRNMPFDEAAPVSNDVMQVSPTRLRTTIWFP